jgi:hypothetical protein
LQGQIIRDRTDILRCGSDNDDWRATNRRAIAGDVYAGRILVCVGTTRYWADTADGIVAIAHWTMPNAHERWAPSNNLLNCVDLSPEKAEAAGYLSLRKKADRIDRELLQIRWGRIGCMLEDCGFIFDYGFNGFGHIHSDLDDLIRDAGLVRQ